MEREPAQIRGVLAERVVVSTPADPFLSLHALAARAYAAAIVSRSRLALGLSLAEMALVAVAAMHLQAEVAA
jgi:hypothetical protein